MLSEQPSWVKEYDGVSMLISRNISTRLTMAISGTSSTDESRIIRRMIDKWLKAGVLEEGRLHRPTAGSPQGGVVSPCLSNVYLHYVLDEWFERDVRPRLKGRAILVRYADDRVPRTY
jgi:retron-type reverse transcriptase